MLREIYLGGGWFSLLAWIGTAGFLGTIAVIAIAVHDTRVPRIRRRRAAKRERTLRAREWNRG